MDAYLSAIAALGLVLDLHAGILAMMDTGAKLLQAAVAKAQTAHGDSLARDRAEATAHLLDRRGRRERCREAMQVAVPRALLRQPIKTLATEMRRRQ